MLLHNEVYRKRVADLRRIKQLILSCRKRGKPIPQKLADDYETALRVLDLVRPRLTVELLKDEEDSDE